MIEYDKWIRDEQKDLIPLDKWQRTISVMARVFKAPAGFLVQHTSLGYQVVLSCKQKSNPYPEGSFIPKDTNIFCRKIVETRSALYVKNASHDDQWSTNPEVRDDGFLSYFGLPVFWPDGTAFGTICVMDYAETDYLDEYLELMVQLRDLVEGDLRLVEQFVVMSDIAYHDDLTGLENRRSFLMAAEHRMALARRVGCPLGLIYVDLDGLKAINDSHGHEAGDRAIQLLATAIKMTIRESDLAARMGGDEFAILSTCESQDDLDNLVARLKQCFDENNINASLGEVLIEDTTGHIQPWLNFADEKMYDMKHAKKQSEAKLNTR